MPHRILIIDDEAHILQVLRLKLEHAGYEVLTAIDGEEGWCLATETIPDLVITDLQMPYMTGLELCRALEDNAATAAIPVVVLTARGYALADEDIVPTNVRDVLSKPFSPRALAGIVTRLLTGEHDTMREAA